MDFPTEVPPFEKLEELVKDEDKVVTIPYFARTLNISIQEAQNCISTYVRDQRKLHPKDLAITYILTGELADQNKRAVIFVKEDDLEDKRSLFSKIDSEVLFSVQKCKQIDFNAISLVDHIISPCEDPLLGSVVSKNCIKRILRIKKLPTPPPSTIKGKSSIFMSKTDSSSSVNSVGKSLPAEKKEEKSKQNGIANMFNKAAASHTTKGKESLQKKPSNTSKKGGLSAFLSKGSSASSIKSESSFKKQSSVSSKPESQSEFEELMDVDEDLMEGNIKTEDFKKDDKEVKKEDTEVKESQKKPEEKGQKKPEKKNKSKRQREKSEEKSTKKRKRIIQRLDSESDDMFENDDGDTIEKSDEEAELPPSPVAKKPLAPKNKIKKALDKTYMDEDGFVVTKTEFVYESPPEDEEEVIVKKEEVKPKLEKKPSASSENDISPPKGAKGKRGKKNNLQNQPTLMNFFKKK